MFSRLMRSRILKAGLPFSPESLSRGRPSLCRAALLLSYVEWHWRRAWTWFVSNSPTTNGIIVEAAWTGARQIRSPCRSILTASTTAVGACRGPSSSFQRQRRPNVSQSPRRPEWVHASATGRHCRTPPHPYAGWPDREKATPACNPLAESRRVPLEQRRGRASPELGWEWTRFAGNARARCGGLRTPSAKPRVAVSGITDQGKVVRDRSWIDAELRCGVLG